MTSSVTEPTVRDTATVTVKEAVDGTRRRKRSTKARDRKGRTVKAVTTHHIKARGDVWAEARRICLPTQRLVIESHTSVLVVNR